MKTKKKQEYVEVIEVPVGSLVLPPNEIKKAFRKAFNAGMRLHQLHEDDSTYDTIHFNAAFEKIMKSFSKNTSKSKYAKGGTKERQEKIKLLKDLKRRSDAKQHIDYY